MNVGDALENLGFSGASHFGDEPTTEAEYLQCVTHPTAKLPPWADVQKECERMRRAECLRAINAERLRRVTAGFMFNDVRYQSDETSQSIIAEYALAAHGAVLNDPESIVGSLRWFDPDADFEWIAEDNTTHAMDAPTFVEFAEALIAHKSAHIKAARHLKSLEKIPEDYADDKHWP
jgi:hypothetical protein